MSELFKRIKEPLRLMNILKYIRNKMRAHKLVVPVLGGGITVLVIVAGWLHLQKDKEEEDSAALAILDNVIKQRMWKQYLSEDGRLPFVFRKTHNLQLDWSGVKYKYDKPTYSKTDKNVQTLNNLRDEVISNVKNNINKNTTHKVIYTNNSSKEQVQKIERVSKLSSSASTSMQQGMQYTTNQGLSFATPEGTLKASTNTLDGLNMNHGFGRSFKNMNTASKANDIRIPDKSIITVTTYNTPNQERYKFEILVTLEGEVQGIFSNIRQRKVQTINIPLNKTLSEDFPATMMIDTQSNGLTMKYEDTLEMENAIEETEISETKITPQKP